MVVEAQFHKETGNHRISNNLAWLSCPSSDIMPLSDIDLGLTASMWKRTCPSG